MSFRKQVSLLVPGLAALALVPAAAGASAPSSESALLKALLHSRELWATIDVCSPSDQPNYVGVRGSMPGDRHSHDKMYMRFRLQYMDTAKKSWVNLSTTGAQGFVYVGPGSGVRQGGRSFQLVPRSGRPAVNLRGLVEYQWRRGSRVVQSTSRTTGAGHKSVAGADPPGYSAATCRIG